MTARELTDEEVFAAYPGVLIDRDNVEQQGLWARSDLGVRDLDIFFPYDGYTVDAVAITEAAGFCGPGEAGDLFRSSWDPYENILRLNGRTLATTHGGGLSQGRAGGFNFYTETVRQLRGTEGPRLRAD